MLPGTKKQKRLINEDGQYADIKEAATIISLPPYSPDLNPIEQVWRVTRREKTHNRFWETLEKLVGVLDNWFSTFKKPNDKLATLCSFPRVKRKELTSFTIILLLPQILYLLPQE